jgi:hypothetical protein
MVAEDDEHNEFWDILGGPGPIAEEDGDDSEWEKHFADHLVLYKYELFGFA